MALIACIKARIKGEGWKLIEIINETTRYLTGKEVDESTLLIGETRVIDKELITEQEVCWLDVENLRKQYKMRSWDEG